MLDPITVVLQSCGQYDAFWEYLVNGQFFDAVYCPYGATMGVVFPLIVFASLGMSMYIYSGSIALPLALTLILGSVVVTQLPGLAAQLVGIVVLLGLAAAGYVLIIRRGPAR